MGIGASLVFLAVGAILAFATRFELAGIDLQTIGWIFMAVGVAGLFFTFLFVRPRRLREVTEVVDEPVYVERDEAAPPRHDHVHQAHRDSRRVHRGRPDRDPGT
jgi:uncharacterized membrane protein